AGCGYRHSGCTDAARAASTRGRPGLAIGLLQGPPQAMVRSLENIPEPATFKIAPPSPSFPIREQLARPPVCLEIGLGVRQVHIVVTARQEAVAQRGEHARLVAVEVVGEDQVNRARVSGSFSEYQCEPTGATPRARCPTKHDPLRLFDCMSYAKAT